ncbi:10 kDa chaperonin 5 [Candidatus Hepatincola sp. Av]
MKLKPLHNNILVVRHEQEQKTAGGILIPDSAQEKPIQGTVVAVGDGLRLENGQIQPLSVKENDTVLFAKWAGTEIKLDGKEYLIMKESDLLGILVK